MRGLYSETKGCHLAGVDGVLGKVKDVLIDDRFWGTNYFVVNTGKWLPGRKVVLSVESVHHADLTSRWLAVKHTVEEVRSAPPLAENEPVSKQYERKLLDHFGWCIPPFLYARTPLVTSTGSVTDPGAVASLVNHFEDRVHLRSANEIIGYEIDASRKIVGIVEDIVFHLENWRVALFVADIYDEKLATSRLVPLSPAWIRHVSWHDKVVRVDLPEDVLINSPNFDRHSLNEQYMDQRLFDHYRKYLNVG
ncbi:MAG: hypothetical protein JXR76_22605 [Deltaproteobacteria bacterium]|nr:hypothetical protein [Deltaproteobacteria bacterium]